ncbi:MAG: glycosyltransferase family 2 protein [Candidatus Pacebacteria bacterium]|nr:glycosyltransferase family 2 protein [Candidatus Paceibacterota bacterium]
MQLSVIVPMLNEADNAVALCTEIHMVLTGAGLQFEILCIDDGSTDGTRATLQKLIPVMPQLRVIAHSHRSGQSSAILTGVKAARAEVIATLDGDGQNDPADIPALLQSYWDWVKHYPDQPVMIAGHRQKRRDSLSKRIGSRLANRIRRGLLHDGTPDTGCGLKVFPRDSYLGFPAFNHNHRYFCALMIRSGGRVLSVAVNHRPRMAGKSNYGNWGRFLVGIWDMIGVMWLMRRPTRVTATEIKSENSKK